MKAFPLLGILVAAAISPVYLNDAAPVAAESGAAVATEQLPGIAATAMQQSNEQVAAMQKALDEDAARRQANP